MKLLFGTLRSFGFAIGALVIGFGVVLAARHFQLSKEATTFLAAGAVAFAVSIRLAISNKKTSPIGPREPASKHPVSRSVWIFRIVGGLVTLLGIFLLLGNRMGTYVSFPYAGSILIVVGAVILVLRGRA